MAPFPWQEMLLWLIDPVQNALAAYMAGTLAGAFGWEVADRLGPPHLGWRGVHGPVPKSRLWAQLWKAQLWKARLWARL